jgi:hypothetical protein
MTKNKRKPQTPVRSTRLVGQPWKYMHTIGGQPGHYYPGEQICYAVRTRPIPLCDSLKQIRCEQQASEKWRVSAKFGPHCGALGWVKVQLPNVADHRPRASKARRGTTALSRGSVHLLCWAKWQSLSQALPVRQVVAIPSHQCCVACIFKNRLHLRRFYVAVAEDHVDLALMA